MEEVISLPKTQTKKNGQKRRRKESLRADGLDHKVAASQRQKQIAEAKAKYLRGGENQRREKRFRKERNKMLRHKLLSEENRLKKSAEFMARAEILLPEQESYLQAENELEKTYKFTQKHVKQHADQNTLSKMLDLKFPDLGSYYLDYTRNGRYMAMASSKGHVAVMDCLRNDTKFEITLKETTRDVKFLHNQGMVAVAQKKHLFIYDDTGLEVHRLKSHQNPLKLEFLPYHFLLASVGRGGWLTYQDTSTGELVAQKRTKLGPCDCMRQNPYNAVLALGHANGTVTMWSPSVSEPLVKMLCHKGPIRDLAFERDGHHMVTAALDGKISIWDVRKYQKLYSYHTPKPPMSIDISDTGLLSLGCGYQAVVWKDAIRTKASSPYMRHTIPGQQITRTRFRPYEDVLALGHTSGLQTVVVPGAGISNFDAFEANPFESTKQMRESEVHNLLEKLQPEMIVLDPHGLGKVDTASPEIIAQEKKEEEALKNSDKKVKLKNKARGRNKIGKKLKKMKSNVISEEREKLREKLNKIEQDRLEKAEEEKRTIEAERLAEGVKAPALSRFKKGR